MNSLSWFIYIADVVGNLNSITWAVLLVTGFAWMILNLAVPITEGDVLDWQDYRKWWTRGVITLLTCGLISAFLPSKNTMYAIAASQLGEQIAQNETVHGIASEATTALRQWIREQTKTGGKQKSE